MSPGMKYQRRQDADTIVFRILKMLDDERLIQDTKDYIAELFKNNVGGHDAAHSLRVYKNALLIAEKEPSCNLMVVSLAALLHDADDRKLFDTEGNANARAFLEKNNIPDKFIEEICEVINAVFFSKNRGRQPETIERMIVQDADRLDALGAIGIARNFSYGGEHGRSLEDSIRHFYEKAASYKRWVKY